jgi:type IV secretory pathway VirJ component
VAASLTDRGIAVVGISSLRYFWREKTVSQVGADLRTLVSAVGRPVFAGGYSFGAEVVPVVLRGWSATERSTIDGLVLVAPGLSASFEIDPLDWLQTPREDPATRVAPAVQQVGLPTLCVMGTEDTESACRGLANVPVFRVAQLPGTHHFNGNYAAVGDTIATFIRSVMAKGQGVGVSSQRQQ